MTGDNQSWWSLTRENDAVLFHKIVSDEALHFLRGIVWDGDWFIFEQVYAVLRGWVK